MRRARYNRLWIAVAAIAFALGVSYRRRSALVGLAAGSLGLTLANQLDTATGFSALNDLAFFSVLLASLFGITFGIYAAMRRNRPADHALRVVSLAGISMPTFWIALVALYVGFYKLNWFPGAGRLDPGVDPPPSVTGLYTIDALLDGNWGLFVQALHHAAESGQVKVMEVLLAAGADPTLRDHLYDGTPASWAEHNDQHEALALLRSRGG